MKGIGNINDGRVGNSKHSRWGLLYASLFFLAALSLRFPGFSSSATQHQAGADCFKCHSNLQVAGTVFSDGTGKEVQPGAPVSLIKEDGGEIVLENTNYDGNIASSLVPNGRYLMRVSSMTSRTWHVIPGQGSCNTCHIVGGNASSVRTKVLPQYHTRIPSDNDCTHCHHFPASMSLAQLKTLGVLNAASKPPSPPGSQVEIAGRVFPFNPADYNITTVRPDVFAPGYFSMFDVILAVAARNGIPIEYHYDESCKTHFITSVNSVSDDYWYHFSYDAGSGNAGELNNRRANRWDEALWRPGVWIKVVRGENVAELKREYQEEIRREAAQGHIIPSVRISINPSSYRGNPPGSGRTTVTRQYSNVQLTPHNLRATGYPSPYSKPFQPGVVTSLDILLSLKDQGKLDVVTSVFYTHFAQHYIDSYYVVALGFPNVGVAHASGRQGFVYTTENGAIGQLPNEADPKLHMTCDISVLHAPDFSYWRWAELGNPYYESTEPDQQTEVDDASVIEDYNAIERGFNLHQPRPNPVHGSVTISFNIFEPGYVNLSVYDASGQKITTLLDDLMRNIGIHELRWQPEKIPTGVYHLVMRYGTHVQIRSISYAGA